jgi:hypothetical protein
MLVQHFQQPCLASLGGNLIPLILQTDSSRMVTMIIQDHGATPH